MVEGCIGEHGNGNDEADNKTGTEDVEKKSFHVGVSINLSVLFVLNIQIKYCKYL